MAMPKMGSRPIVVDGQKYRWRIRRKPTYCQGLGWTNLTVSVEKFSYPGTVLVLNMGEVRPDTWAGVPKSRAVLPREIANAIRTAHQKGWLPNSSGKPFLLSIRPADS